ncbi:MAG: T9SS type A sorting domain-containing protein [Bacteroidales bacterium]
MKKRDILFILCLIIASCYVNAEPTITVLSVDNIKATTVKFRGSIQNLGTKMPTIAKRGFVYAPVNNPMQGDTITYQETAAKKNEIYSREIVNFDDFLQPGTQYWVKAFITFKAKNSDTEFVYSDKFYFSTISPINDYSTAEPVESVSLTTASLKGTIDSAGNSFELVDCGFVYSKSPNPTLGLTGTEYTRSTFNSNKVYPKIITSELINLEASSTYYYRIWTINKYTNKYSDTAYSPQKSFITLHACGLVPTNLDTVYVKTDEVGLKWKAQEGQTKFEIEYDLSGHTLGEGNKVIVENNNIILKNLESNRSYTSYVRAVCPDMNSEWSLMRPFHTLPALCEKVLGLHLDNVTHITAKISWSPGQEGEHQWEVAFANKKDPYPNKSFLVKDNPVFLPAGLIINNEYKVKVRTVCDISFDTVVNDPVTGNPVDTVMDSTVYGLWSEDLIFSTASSSLQSDMSVEENISIFPNPASDVINFFYRGNLNDIQKIEIYSLLGSLVYVSNTLPKELHTSTLGSGTFIVHITTSNGIKAEKIIIKKQ